MPPRNRLSTIQAQTVEVGRIRLGTSTPKTSRAGKAYNEPVRLERFRLTSKSRQLIEAAAAAYGGEPGTWTPQGTTTEQWEVIIEADSLPVIVPPEACSQFFEQWNGGTCVVRCTGLRELLKETPCVCGPDPERRACKPYTRLSLLLAELPGVGVWRLETHGYYAAAELPAVADLLSAAGGNVPARLEMERREAKVPDPRKPGQIVATAFMVPVLHVEATPAQLMQVFGGRGPAAIGGSEPVALDNAERVAIEAPPAAPVSPPVAPEQGVEALLARIRTAIDRTDGKDAMLALKARMDAQEMGEEDRAAINGYWLARARVIAQAMADQAVAAPAAPPAVPQAPPAAVDRQAVFLEINTWAGYKNYPMSKLQELFLEFMGTAESDLRSADGPTLLRFRDHLKGPHE